MSEEEGKEGNHEGAERRVERGDEEAASEGRRDRWRNGDRGGRWSFRVRRRRRKEVERGQEILEELC